MTKVIYVVFATDKADRYEPVSSAVCYASTREKAELWIERLGGKGFDYVIDELECVDDEV